MNPYRKRLKADFDYSQYYITILKQNIPENINIKGLTSDYKKINLEIGCGNGHFLEKKCLINKDEFFIGNEIKLKHMKKAILKTNREDNHNSFFINGDINLVLPLFENNFLDDVYINFPDPWPKKRHLKRRIIKQNFLDILSEKQKKNKKLYFVTDHFEYMQYSIEVFKEYKNYKNQFENFYVNDLPDYPDTLFASVYKKEGRKIYYSIYENKKK